MCAVHALSALCRYRHLPAVFYRNFCEFCRRIICHPLIPTGPYRMFQVIIQINRKLYGWLVSFRRFLVNTQICGEFRKSHSIDVIYQSHWCMSSYSVFKGFYVTFLHSKPDGISFHALILLNRIPATGRFRCKVHVGIAASLKIQFVCFYHALVRGSHVYTNLIFSCRQRNLPHIQASCALFQTSSIPNHFNRRSFLICLYSQRGF